MKNFFFLFAFLFPFMANGQFDVSGYASQQGGVELNPLRNPSVLILDVAEEDMPKLIPTPFLSHSKIYLHVKNKTNKTTFGFKPKLVHRFYPELKEANQLRGTIAQYVDFKINKQWKMYERITFLTNQRNGEALEQDQFSIPRSYQRWQVGAGAMYKWNRYWMLNMEGRYIKNNFQSEEGLNYYHSLEGLGSIQRKFRKGQILREVRLDLSLEKRNWIRESFQEEEEEEAGVFQQALMDYWMVQWAAVFQVSEELRLKPVVRLAGRNAQVQSRNWQGVKAGLNTTWEKGSFRLNWIGSIALRNHPNLTPGGSDNDPLKYLYWRNTINTEYFYQENWSVILTLQHTQRFSSYKDPTSNAFRSYDNVYAGVGLKVRF